MWLVFVAVVTQIIWLLTVLLTAVVSCKKTQTNKISKISKKEADKQSIAPNTTREDDEGSVYENVEPAPMNCSKQGPVFGDVKPEEPKKSEMTKKSGGSKMSDQSTSSVIEPNRPRMAKSKQKPISVRLDIKPEEKSSIERKDGAPVLSSSCLQQMSTPSQGGQRAPSNSDDRPISEYVA